MTKPVASTEERLATAEVWGAFVGGTLAGGIGLARDPRRKCRHKADVVAMYVMPEYARRGIARALLDEVVAFARGEGLTHLTLTVTQTNAAARALYATAGFETFGLEPCAIRVDGVFFAKEYMVLALDAG